MSSELLTTREVEQLIQLNRVTIYRLIREDDFPAVKVGGQWRFPRSGVEAWLARQTGPETLAPPLTDAPQTPAALDASLFHGPELAPLLRAFARSTGLSIFVTDLAGNTVAECVACRHPFCALVHALPAGEQACIAAHYERIIDEDTHLVTCAAGMRYIEAPVTINDRPLARVMMGPVMNGIPEAQLYDDIGRFSTGINADRDALFAALDEIPAFSGEQVTILSRLLSQVISTMLGVAAQQRQMVARLQEIAALAGAAKPATHPQRVPTVRVAVEQETPLLSSDKGAKHHGV